MNRAFAFLFLALTAVTVLGDGVETSRPGARALALPKGDDVFHFVVYGDRTGGPASGVRVLAQAVGETNLLDPDLVMTVGDLVNGYNATDAWLVQMNEFRGIMDRLSMPWYPVAGNHDIYWRGKGKPEGHHEANFEKHFGPLWYFFEHKNAAFIVLYSDEGDRRTNKKGWRNAAVNQFSETQLTWLAATLKKTTKADHVFVFVHHPRWIPDWYPGNNWDTVHKMLVKARNVSTVFGGHIHRRRYEGKRDGIEYMTLATVGGHMPMEARGTGWLNHFDVITVRKDRVSYATIPVGATMDPKVMTLERWTAIDLLLATQPKHGGTVVVSSKGEAVGDYELTLQNPTDAPIEVVISQAPRTPSWWLRPDHAHARIEPGKSTTMKFHWARLPRGDLRMPTFEMHVDYLAPTQRVSLPPRVITASVRLGKIDEDFWGTSSGSLRLPNEGAAARVESSMLNLGQKSFTVEAWVNLKSHSRRAAVVSKAEKSGFGLFLYDGVPSFDVSAGGRYGRARADKKAGRLPLNQWVHLAGVYDGKRVRLYRDGALVGEGKAAGKRVGNALPIYLGADPDKRGQATSSMLGQIDEVRISSGAIYSEAFKPGRRLKKTGSTLLLQTFDRGLGALYPDRAGNGKFAVGVGTAKWMSEESK
jgi:3',5'-cyclic AMP phosphodiesterase CpdA